MGRTVMKSRQSKKSAALHKAAQLALFPLTARLRRIRPELNEWRFYAMSVQPDLFGGAALVRQWDRIGTTGSQCLDLYPDEGTAINALSKMVRYRQKRGYTLAVGQD